jgi:putative molybdopterin biosynthesis protein
MKKQRAIVSHQVRQAREAQGLSQTELAAAAQLTRQTIGAIECGRATPSVEVALRLAKLLEHSVEELFAPAPAAEVVVAQPAQPYLPGRLMLAHIGGRWVAHSLQRDGVRIAADAISVARGTRTVHAELLRPQAEVRDNVLIAGCAAGLSLLADRVSTTRGAARYIARSCSSTAALEALARNHVHLAGVHLVDGKTGEANVADVRRIVRGSALVLVTLARWEMGLVVAPAQTRRIRSAADLARRGVRVALRESGSGARRLMERELHRHAVPLGAVLASGLPTSGHLEVAQAVALGAADTGVATRDAALAFGLTFVPLAEERYDLALRADSESDPRIQRLLNTLSGQAFRRELSCLGYDVRSSGERVAQLRAA